MAFSNPLTKLNSYAAEKTGGFSGSRGDAMLGTMFGVVGGLVGNSIRGDADQVINENLQPIWNKQLPGLYSGKYDKYMPARQPIDFNDKGLSKRYKDVEAYKRRFRRATPMGSYKRMNNPEVDELYATMEARKRRSPINLVPGHTRRRHTFTGSPTSSLRKSPHRRVGIFADE